MTDTSTKAKTLSNHTKDGTNHTNHHYKKQKLKNVKHKSENGFHNGHKQLFQNNHKNSNKQQINNIDIKQTYPQKQLQIHSKQKKGRTQNTESHSTANMNINNHNKKRSKPRNKKKIISQVLYFPPAQFSHRFGTQFYTIVVPECRIVFDQQTHTKFAVYKFEVKRGRQTRDIFYRYSEIRQLHDFLCSTSDTLGSIAIRCSFPNKTWFKSLDEKFLDKRRKALESYFHQLLSSSRVISQIECITKFLQLDQFIVKEWWKE